MKLKGTYTFDAPREVVWEMFLNPDVLAKIMPGCQKLEQVGDSQYKGKLKIRVGPVQGIFQGDVKLSDLKPPHTYTMDVNGRGPSGMVDGNGHVRLEEEDGQTVMYYEGEAKVSGKIAGVGQRLMYSSGKAITKQSLDNLNKQIEARQKAAAAPAAEETAAQTTDTTASSKEEAAPDKTAGAPAQKAEPSTSTPASSANGYSPDDVPAPTQTEFALGVAKEMANDFVPEEQQKYVFTGVALLAGYLLFNWWTNLVARRVARILREERGRF